MVYYAVYTICVVLSILSNILIKFNIINIVLYSSLEKILH